MAKVGPNTVNFAIAKMIGQLLTVTTYPNDDMIYDDMISLNDWLLKNTAHVGPSKHFVLVHLCIFVFHI